MFLFTYNSLHACLTHLLTATLKLLEASSQYSTRTPVPPLPPLPICTSALASLHFHPRLIPIHLLSPTRITHSQNLSRNCDMQQKSLRLKSTSIFVSPSQVIPLYQPGYCHSHSQVPLSFTSGAILTHLPLTYMTNSLAHSKEAKQTLLFLCSLTISHPYTHSKVPHSLVLLSPPSKVNKQNLDIATTRHLPLLQPRNHKTIALIESKHTRDKS